MVLNVEPSLSAVQGNVRNREGTKLAFYKTKMCPWFPNRCRLGDECNWAHSKDELRSRIDLTGTRLCAALFKKGWCTDPNCRYAHSREELRHTSDIYKTSMCVFWMKGSCVAGANCRYAHGDSEIRCKRGSLSISNASGLTPKVALTDGTSEILPTGDSVFSFSESPSISNEPGLTSNATLTDGTIEILPTGDEFPVTKQSTNDQWRNGFETGISLLQLLVDIFKKDPELLNSSQSCHGPNGVLMQQNMLLNTSDSGGFLDCSQSMKNGIPSYFPSLLGTRDFCRDNNLKSVLDCSTPIGQSHSIELSKGLADTKPVWVSHQVVWNANDRCRS